MDLRLAGILYIGMAGMEGIELFYSVKVGGFSLLYPLVVHWLI